MWMLNLFYLYFNAYLFSFYLRDRSGSPIHWVIPQMPATIGLQAGFHAGGRGPSTCTIIAASWDSAVEAGEPGLKPGMQLSEAVT